MASAHKKKVVHIKKYRRPVNLGLIMFVILFIYIVIYLFFYFSKERISIYEVTIQGSITKDKVYTGMILRDETVIRADAAGYVNYYLREGERASVGDLIYTLDESGHVSETLFAESSLNLSDVDLNSLKKDISSFCMEYQAQDFSSIYNFKVDLNYNIMELANLSSIANLDQVMSTSTDIGFFKRHYADRSGNVAYYTDGYEEMEDSQITQEMFDVSSYEKTSLASSSILQPDSPVYKIVTTNDWSLIFPLTDEELSEYGSRSRLKVHFFKDDFTVTAGFSVFANSTGGYGKLTFDRYMVRYISDRYLSFEIVEEIETGLKIPVSAVTEKNFYTVPVGYLANADDGQVFYVETYDESGASTIKHVAAQIYQTNEYYHYVDTSSFSLGDTLVKPESDERYKIGMTAPIKGVYNVNQGYTVFRQIEIISENEEYYIVSPNSPYGVSLYDHIILNSKTVEENQVIYQ